MANPIINPQTNFIKSKNQIASDLKANANVVVIKPNFFKQNHT